MLIKQLTLQNISQITSVLDLQFNVKHSEYYFFRCIQIECWNGMSQNILTFLYMQPNQTGGYGQILQNVNVRF